MTAEQRRDIIGRWVSGGLNWRAWTIRETTAVLYTQLRHDLYMSGHIDALRDLLRLAGNTSNLAALDREIMGQTHGVQVADTPPLRGHH